MNSLNRREVLKLAVAGAAAGSVATATMAADEKPDFNGTWTYRSFLIDPGSAASPAPGAKVGEAFVWAPPGKLEVRTDNNDQFQGTLTFPSRPGMPPTVLKIAGRIIPGSDSQPASLEAKGEGTMAIFKIAGWFAPDSPARYHFPPQKPDTARETLSVRGSVMVIKNDVAQQPDGTVGAFVLTRNP